MRGAPGSVAITGIGLACALGPDAATACAAARAGITREAALKTLNFADQLWGEEPVAGHAVPFAAAGFVGVGKLLALGRLALQDLLANANHARANAERTGLYLNLSDKYFEDAQSRAEHDELGASAPAEWSPPSATWEEQTRHVAVRLAQLGGFEIPPANQRLFYGGHAGIVEAAAEAAHQIDSGGLERCIVGGIDSCVEPDALVAAVRQGALKTAVSPVGFMPGEAAAFFLLERLEPAAARRAPVRAVLEGMALAEGEGRRPSGPPSLGAGLARAVAESIAAANGSGTPAGLLLGDLNGDVFRAMEWGYAVVRLARVFRAGDLPLWLPAVSIGEVGAATGAVSVAMGVRAWERNYAPADHLLIWLSSDSGTKAAMRLRRFKP